MKLDVIFANSDELYGIDKIPVDSAAISETAARQEASYGPHLSVLCLNAFLIPPSISWNPYLWAPFWSCRRPRQRAEEVRRKLTVTSLYSFVVS